MHKGDNLHLRDYLQTKYLNVHLYCLYTDFKKIVRLKFEKFKLQDNYKTIEGKLKYIEEEIKKPIKVFTIVSNAFIGYKY